MTLPDCLSVEEPSPGYPVYVVRHPAASARVALNGAHVMEWTPAGQAPVLYLSPDALLEPGKAIRGGVPVCWPWFNAHPDDAGKPMHGLARNRFWQLAEAAATAEGVQLAFTLDSDAATLALWPHAFRARVELRIGARLDIRLETVNTGPEAFVLGEALHTYLQVGDIRQVRVRGLDGAEYLDTVGPPARRRQQGEIRFDREIDRQYASTGSVEVEDHALGRTLRVDKTGSATTVVWNPWIEKSKRLADLPDEAYFRFLCVEAANAGAGAVTVAPGARHALQTLIRLT